MQLPVEPSKEQVAWLCRDLQHWMKKFKCVAAVERGEIVTSVGEAGTRAPTEAARRELAALVKHHFGAPPTEAPQFGKTAQFQPRGELPLKGGGGRGAATSEDLQQLPAPDTAQISAQRGRLAAVEDQVRTLEQLLGSQLNKARSAEAAAEPTSLANVEAAGGSGAGEAEASPGSSRPSSWSPVRSRHGEHTPPSPASPPPPPGVTAQATVRNLSPAPVAMPTPRWRPSGGAAAATAAAAAEWRPGTTRESTTANRIADIVAEAEAQIARCVAVAGGGSQAASVGASVVVGPDEWGSDSYRSAGASPGSTAPDTAFADRAAGDLRLSATVAGDCVELRRSVEGLKRRMTALADENVKLRTRLATQAADAGPSLGSQAAASADSQQAAASADSQQAAASARAPARTAVAPPPQRPKPVRQRSPPTPHFPPRRKAG